MTITSSRRSPAQDALDSERKLRLAPLPVTPAERPQPPKCPITPMQLQIIDLVTEGLTNLEIGERLQLPEVYVKEQLKYAFRALPARSRAHAVAICIRAEWI